MADLKLELSPQSAGTDEHYDLVLGPTGDLVLTSGEDAIKQAVIAQLKTFYGDWFLNMDVGLPYYQQVLGVRGKATLNASFEASMQSAILNVPGVLALLSWNADLDRKARRLSVSFTAQITGGVVQWSVPIGLG